MLTTICPVCKKEFKFPEWQLKHNRKYCSNKCRFSTLKQKRPFRQTGELINCLICGKEKWKIQYHLIKGQGKYCSQKCYDISKKGKQIKGFIRFNRSSKEYKEKLSASQIKRYDRDGRSVLYLTNRNLALRKCLKYKEWRLAVFTRDNFKCIKDGSKRQLEANHKISFAKLLKQYDIKSLEEAYDCEALWDIDNGETLCHDCHKNTSNYKGKGHGAYDNSIQLQYNKIVWEI